MNKYVYAECPQDYWPSIKTIMAKSYNDAIERLVTKYSEQLDDDSILEFSDWQKFCEYLNDNYSIALSDIEDYEEI